MAALALGLDLGTTSVKLAVVRNLGHKFQRVHEASAEHGAYKTLEEHPERREQDVASILAAVRGLISDLGQRAALDDLSSIAVTGQMHGVVLWRRTGWSGGARRVRAVSARSAHPRSPSVRPDHVGGSADRPLGVGRGAGAAELRIWGRNSGLACPAPPGRAGGLRRMRHGHGPARVDTVL